MKTTGTLLIVLIVFSTCIMLGGGCKSKKMYYAESSQGSGMPGDSDGDGISDKDETDLYGTSPYLEDNRRRRPDRL